MIRNNHSTLSLQNLPDPKINLYDAHLICTFDLGGFQRVTLEMGIISVYDEAHSTQQQVQDVEGRQVQQHCSVGKILKVNFT